MKPIVLHDKDARGHSIKLVRAHNGDIYAEVDALHNGHHVYSTLRLGASWEILPQLAGLA